MCAAAQVVLGKIAKARSTETADAAVSVGIGRLALRTAGGWFVANLDGGVTQRSNRNARNSRVSRSARQSVVMAGSFTVVTKNRPQVACQRLQQQKH